MVRGGRTRPTHTHKFVGVAILTASRGGVQLSPHRQPRARATSHRTALSLGQRQVRLGREKPVDHRSRAHAQPPTPPQPPHVGARPFARRGPAEGGKRTAAQLGTERAVGGHTVGLLLQTRVRAHGECVGAGGACGHQPPDSATPPPTFAFGKTLTDCAPIARPLQARVSHGLDGDRAVRRGGLMNAPSSESRGIECSLLELYEPNEHAPSMSAFDILRDLAKRSVTMQDALSEKVLSRQRLGKRLRQPLEEALRRVALTYSDVHIEDDGHGAWVVSGLQQRPQTDLHTAAPSSSTDSVGRSLASTGDEHLPSRGNSSSHVGPKRARLAKPEAEILQPATKFQWKGQTYEIDRHDSMQSTPAKQYYHLRRDGKPLGSSYARDHHWIVAEQPTSLLEESLLGFVSKVMDWRTINSWDDEKVCRQRKRAAIRVHPNHRALSAHARRPAVRTETRG